MFDYGLSITLDSVRFHFLLHTFFSKVEEHYFFKDKLSPSIHSMAVATYKILL